MRRWNLPQDVVAAVRFHHELDSAAPCEQLTAAVQIGDMMAHQLLGEDVAGTDIITPATAALATLRLDQNDVSRLMAESQAELEKTKDILEL